MKTWGMLKYVIDWLILSIFCIGFRIVLCFFFLFSSYNFLFHSHLLFSLLSFLFFIRSYFTVHILSQYSTIQHSTHIKFNFTFRICFVNSSQVSYLPTPFSTFVWYFIMYLLTVYRTKNSENFFIFLLRYFLSISLKNLKCQQIFGFNGSNLGCQLFRS